MVAAAAIRGEVSDARDVFEISSETHSPDTRRS
jgi:hypothetical protein